MAEVEGDLGDCFLAGSGEEEDHRQQLCFIQTEFSTSAVDVEQLAI